MSFEKRKKLADLKAECQSLFEERLALLLKKKENIILSMRDEAVYFLQDLGFSIKKSILLNHPLVVEADYKGEMQVTIAFSDHNDSFLGADITIDISYLNQKFEFCVNLSRQSFGIISDLDLDNAIAEYQALKDKLAALNGSDIDGKYAITAFKQGDNPAVFSNISDLLKVILEM